MIVNKEIKPTIYFWGRLGNICYELCSLFYYIDKLNLNFKNLVLDLNYQDVSLYHTSHQYVIRDNLDFFWYFKNNFKENFNLIDNKWIVREVYKKNILKSDIMYKLFYNKSLYDKYIQKYPYIFKTTAIHVRRTDFFNMSPSVVLKDDYIKTIIEQNNHIMIFSDDMDYCISKFKNSNVEFIQNIKEYEDIIMMSLCNKIIYKNSSFSNTAKLINEGIKKYGL